MTGLAKIYASDGRRSFDNHFVERLFGEGISIREGGVDGAEEEESWLDSQRGLQDSHLEGCRIGFDLGGSDRKCAAVIDGEVIFSAEIPWDPYFQSDPRYHYEGVMDSLRMAARHLPRVDAIGGSAAGVYVDNRVKVASLFRGVPDRVFQDEVEGMFLRIADEWDGVPFRIVNDGDVSALAGSMAVGEGCVMGLAMGTSTAVGYVDGGGQINGWLSELAFAPIDFQREAPLDEWSGDSGCGVQYLSQQAVSRLIPASGLSISPALSAAEQLVEVQEAMERGDERAESIYETIGSYLGYAIPQISRFYEVRHLQLLGRVLSGRGGDVLLEKARAVVRDEFPVLAASLAISTPDEQIKRHGQAIAAASLPQI
ncbi:ROK family protein [Roseibacillus ishigakijimensis]|uniref:ROK family protein n=1 Tax=Roseibacillus ishigakijimensis TaxID=454146 RepID=UPI001F3ECF13|nr:ROK family protein [Roseibacillus ishigakijimensis]